MTVKPSSNEQLQREIEELEEQLAYLKAGVEPPKKEKESGK